MAGLSITGQMKVSTLQAGFLKEFGLTLRIYDGRSFADPTQTLAQVRKKKGGGKALSVAKNMKVGNLEDKFEEEFGLKVQVAGSNDSYLCDNELTLNGAQKEDEKKLGRKAKKAAHGHVARDSDLGGDEPVEQSDSVKGERVTLSNYFNLRFGYCDENSEGDFIDNISGEHNIYVGTGTDGHGKDHLLIHAKGKFEAIKDGDIQEKLEDLSKTLQPMFDQAIAKGLIQSAYDNDPDGIIDHAPAFEEHYFDTRDDDDVDGYAPCYFAIGSVTYDCGCEVDLASGKIYFGEDIIQNFPEFYGYVDEDDTYAVGAVDYQKL